MTPTATVRAIISRRTLTVSSKIIHQLTHSRNARGVRVRKFTAVDEIKYNDLLQRLDAYRISNDDLSQYNIAVEERDLPKPAKKSVSSHDIRGRKKSALPDADEVTLENQYEKLAAVVTPLWKKPYEKQLKLKFDNNMQILRKFGAALKEVKTKTFIDPDNTPCALGHTIPSPQIEAYRNKDEFSIRHGVDGSPKTVGFFLNSTAENPDTFCVGPDKLLITKEQHKRVAKEFENYIRASPLPACLNFSEGGYWRNIIVRSNVKGEVMAIIIMHPQNLSEEQLNNEMLKLKEYFAHESRSELNLKSLYFQACAHTRCTHAQAPFRLLFGEPHLIEEMNGYKYYISPESFFQVNTLAAENLYKVVFNACKPNKSMTVLDICCGTGPVSLTFSKHVKRCIGIDISQQAVEDAGMNARLNDVRNVEFYAGKSENLLPDILNNIYAEELIAVINPARSPLGKNLMKFLREKKYLKKIVFVTCKPEAMIPDLIQLCCPNEHRGRLGQPFIPLKAVPVDLFPHTKHCELVLLMQRL